MILGIKKWSRSKKNQSKAYLFLKEIEAMTKLYCAWGYGTKQKINRTLLSSPFVDH